MNKHGGCDAEVVHQSPSNAASDPYSMRDIYTSAWRSSSSTEEEKASCCWPQRVHNMKETVGMPFYRIVEEPQVEVPEDKLPEFFNKKANYHP